MVKVVYRDGETDLFNSDDFRCDSERGVFKVIVGGHFVMIPIDVVRSIGIGRFEEIAVCENGHTKEIVREFVYE